MMPASAPDWYVVIPVKGGPHAKSRLAVDPHDVRTALARAIAEDCVTAVLAGLSGRRVVVATSDRDVTQWASRLGAGVASDPARGLDEAVGAGIRAAQQAAGTPHCAVAVLLGDLPALRPQDLTAALAACSRHERAIVPDLDGTGTVLLSARDAGRLTPSFGAGSARRHEALGHARLDLDLPRLRTDVDDTADLSAALALGVGPRTAVAVSDLETVLRGTLSG